MSGFEVAGIVLGTLPLVIEFLKSTAVGIESARGFGARQFQRQLGNWECELTAKRASLLNNLASIIRSTEILGDNVPVHEIHDMLQTNTVSKIFTDPVLTLRLDDLLGHNRVPFELCVQQVRLQLDEVVTRLGIDLNVVQKTTNKTGRESFKEAARRIKTVLELKVYKELIANLSAANSNLNDITEQIRQLRQYENVDRSIRLPLQKLRRLRENAHDMLKSFTNASLWPCQNCTKGHTLWLRLRDYHDKSASVESFRISFSSRVAEPSKACDRNLRTYIVRCEDAAPIKTFSASTSSTVPVIPTVSVTSVNSVSATAAAPLQPVTGNAIGENNLNRSHSHKSSISTNFKGLLRSTSPSLATTPKTKTVQWAGAPISPTASTVSVNTAQPSPTQQQIHNLCEFLNKTLATSPTQAGCHGQITSKVMLDRCYQIMDPDLDYAGLDTVSLSSLTCTLRGCQEDHFDQSPEFQLDDRLLLAATLAQSVFELEGSWLADDWSCQNILIPVAADDVPRVDELQVMRNISDTLIANKKSPKAMLTGLGFALAEILLGRHIDAGPSDLQKIQDLLQRIYRNFGQGSNIGNAVRECIFWSGSTSSDGFDDQEFGTQVYKLIIWPIIQQYRRHKELPL